MPKLKTKKSASKRFSFTATGKIKFKRAGLRHQLSHRQTGQKVPLRKAGYMADGDRKLTEKCIPYGRS